MAETFAITDGTTTVSFIDSSGFEITDWKMAGDDLDTQEVPAYPADGAGLVHASFENVTETITLKLTGTSDDNAASQLQALERLLDKAARYHLKSWQRTPVYLSVQSAAETNPRYYLIYWAHKLAWPSTWLDTQFKDQHILISVKFAIRREPFGRGTAPGALPSLEPLHTADVPTLPYNQFNSLTGNGLARSSDAALSGAYGLKVTAAGAGSESYISFTATNETRLIVEFLFDPNSLAMANGDIFSLVVGRGSGASATNFYVELRNNNGTYQLRITAFEDGGGTQASTLANISDASQTVKVDWQASSAPGANDGFAKIFIDGSSTALTSVTGLDNVGYDVDELRVGTCGGLDAGTSGIIYLDNIRWEDADDDIWHQEATFEYPTLVLIPNFKEDNAITHVFNYDDSEAAFGGNLVGTTGWNFFSVSGSTPANADIVYFGCDDGVFHNFVLNLTSLFVGVDYTAKWEYYDGAAWEEFTDEAAPNNFFDDFSFKLQGHSAAASTWKLYPVMWYGPADWATVAVNGVTAYWVRLRITGLTSHTTHATQGEQVIYTANNPYLELAATNLDGDAESLLHMMLYNITGWITLDESTKINRVFIGSKSRGLTNFVSRLNFGGDNPAEWTVTADPAEITDSTTTADPGAPSGTRGQRTFTTLQTMEECFEFAIRGDDAADDWRGEYRFLMRCKQIGGSNGEVRVKAAMSMDDTQDFYLWVSETIALQDTDQEVEVIDFGKIKIPPGDEGDSGSTLHFLKFHIEAEADSTSPDLYFYDLIFIPIDEWSIVLNDPLIDDAAGNGYYTGAAICNQRYQLQDLEIDGGILSPYPRAALKYTTVTDGGAPDPPVAGIAPSWEFRGEKAAILPNKQTRLYFFFENWLWNSNNGTPPIFSRAHSAAAIELRASERWKGLRGSDG